MDWTPLLGHARPIEQDALRLLTLVHQLGAPSPRGDVRTIIVGEERLLALDHLVRHPETLAFVLIDQLGHRPDIQPRRAGLLRRIHDLLPPTAEAQRPLSTAPLHHFHTGAWERSDDALAFLACRGLLWVRPWAPDGPRPELSYQLPEAAARQLEDTIYPTEPALAPLRERSRLLADGLLKESRGAAPDATRLPDLRAVATRIESFRHREQIAPEDDLLAHYFHSTLGKAP